VWGTVGSRVDLAAEVKSLTAGIVTDPRVISLGYGKDPGPPLKVGET
jgi:hypothetical protein